MKTYVAHDLLSASRKFMSTQHWPIVEAATKSYIKGSYNEAQVLLNTLPSDKVLLAGLIEKVKGKSVYSNLKKIANSESVDRKDAIIAMSSLLTHAAIESKTNGEFASLFPDIYEKIGKLIR